MLGFCHDLWTMLDNVRQVGLLDVEAAAKLLQVAILIARAGKAVLVMVGKDELQDADLRIPYNLRIGMDVHAFPDIG